MSRLKVLRWAMTLALLAWAGGCTATAPPQVAPEASVGSAPAAQSWQVEAGAESPDRAVQMLQFYPAAITVNVGDTITWTNPTAELHTVTFLAPGQERPRFDRNDPLQTAPQGNGQIDGADYPSSGLLQDGQSFTATVSEAGTYGYICLVHRQQLGTVVVNPAGTPYEHTQAEYAATKDAAAPAIADWQARLATYEPTTRVRLDGTREYVISGGMGNGIVAVMRFWPQAMDIRAGDTITWDNTDPETPHVVTFGPPQGSPIAAWGDPQAFNGTDPLSSGYIGPGWPGGPTYSVTFTTAGQLGYICVLHVQELMLGSVTVSP